MRGIPILPLAVTLPLLLLLLRPRLVIPHELRSSVRVLTVFALLVVGVFIVQSAAGVHVNRRMEIYIFAMNGLLGPVVFVWIARLRADQRVRLLQAATVISLMIIFMAIVASVGLNVTDFDKQDRLKLPLVANSVAATSLSLVLGLLFVANLSVQPRRGSLRLRPVLLLALGFCIYLLATRFVFLIVAASLGWVFLRNLKRGAIIRILIGLGVLVLVAIYVSSAGSDANQRFLVELQTFELVTTPLSDRSFAIRVAQWYQALQDIPENPLGYGYMTFVTRNVFSDPILGWRGYNTHNEILLQLLALGWIPPLLLGAFFWRLWGVHRSAGTAGDFVLVLIGLGISGLFETFSNNPNAVNTVVLAYAVLGLTLPASLGAGSAAPNEVILPEERTQRQVREYAGLDER